MDKLLTYGILAVLALITISATMHMRKRRAHLRLVNKINDHWGKNPLQYKECKMNSNVPGYYVNMNINSNENNLFSIDDITWNDLDMDSIFQRLNNTLSTVGEQCLYYILRKPLMEDTKLEERNRVVEFFRSNQNHRLKVQILLAKLGKVKTVDITNYLVNDYKGASSKGLYYKFLAFAFLLSPFLMVISLPLGFFLIITFFFINMTVHYKKRYEIESHLEAFNYIVNLIIYAEKISNLEINEINAYRQKLKNSLRTLKGIISRSFFVLYKSEDPFLEYIKVVLLGELIAYESMFKLILKYRNNLIEIFDTVGLIDSLISIASYRDSIQYFATPKLYKLSDTFPDRLDRFTDGFIGRLDRSTDGFTDRLDRSTDGFIDRFDRFTDWSADKFSNKFPDNFFVENAPSESELHEKGLQNYISNITKPKNKLCFKDIYHPLINEPVANSLEINKPVLVTGSNASGKSTFLKTIAINAIFAQTIYTCLAKNYYSCYFMIFTSMALKDSLIDGESYYIVEIKSLKRIIDSINPSAPCLCIIDEVLRGTNTVERIAASSQVLFFLSQSNCLPIAATHDLELAHMLRRHYGNYHFQEYVTDNDIMFDYKIYPGKSSTRNAIKLLKLMGYKDSIVESSEARAKAFMEQGKWPEI